MPNARRLSGDEYAAIQNLYAYYNLCSDAGDATGYASCFTEQGVLAVEELGIRIQGWDALQRFKTQDAAARGGRYRRHWNGSVYLERVDAVTVRGRGYLHAYNGSPGSLPDLADVGVYEDTLVEVDGAWRFAERRLRFDATSFQPPR